MFLAANDSPSYVENTVLYTAVDPSALSVGSYMLTINGESMDHIAQNK